MTWRIFLIVEFVMLALLAVLAIAGNTYWIWQNL